MKKFSLLLLMLLIGIGSTWADFTPQVSTSTARYYYSFYCKGRNYHVPTDLADGTFGCGNDKTAEAAQFRFETGDAAGQYYIISRLTGKYWSCSGTTSGSKISLVDGKTSATQWVIVQNGDYISLKPSGCSEAIYAYHNGYANPTLTFIISSTTSDDYSKWTATLQDKSVVVTTSTTGSYAMMDGSSSDGTSWCMSFTATGVTPNVKLTHTRNNLKKQTANDYFELSGNTARTWTVSATTNGYVAQGYKLTFTASDENDCTITPTGGTAVTSSSTTDTRTVSSSSANTFDIPASTIARVSQIEVFYKEVTVPFETTTITDGKFADETKWYTMKVNRSTAEYSYYNTIKNGIDNVTSLTDAQKPYSYFCFTGDLTNGYKIYNAATGATKAFYVTGSNNAIGYMVDAANATSFILKNNGSNVVFYQGTSTCYLNDVEDKWGVWDNGSAATDAGSTFVIEEVTDADAVNTAVTTAITAWSGKTQGTSLGYFNAEISSLTSTATTNLASATTVAAKMNVFTTMVTSITSKLVKPEAGRYYRLKSYDGAYATSTGSALTGNTTAAIKNIFKFEDAENGTFYLKSDNNTYVQANATQSAQITLGSTKARYTINYSQDGRFVIFASEQKNENRSLHRNGENVVGWWDYAGNNNSWALEEVTDVYDIVIPSAVSSVTASSDYTGTTTTLTNGMFYQGTPALTCEGYTVGTVTKDETAKTATVPLTNAMFDMDKNHLFESNFTSVATSSTVGYGNKICIADNSVANATWMKWTEFDAADAKYQWTFVASTTDGTLKFKNVSTNKYIGTVGNNFTMTDENGALNFIATKSSDGHYNFKTSDGKYLHARALSEYCSGSTQYYVGGSSEAYWIMPVTATSEGSCNDWNVTDAKDGKEALGDALTFIKTSYLDKVGTNPGQYTSTSAADLQSLYDDAKKVYDNEDATSEQIATAFSTFASGKDAAIAKLEKVGMVAGYYMFKNTGTGKYMYYIQSPSDTYQFRADTEGTAAETAKIFHVTANGDDWQIGTYDGKVMKKIDYWQPCATTETESEYGVWTVAAGDNFDFSFQMNGVTSGYENYAYLRQNTSNLPGVIETSDIANGYWSLEPVDIYTVTLDPTTSHATYEELTIGNNNYVAVPTDKTEFTGTTTTGAWATINTENKTVTIKTAAKPVSGKFYTIQCAKNSKYLNGTDTQVEYWNSNGGLSMDGTAWTVAPALDIWYLDSDKHLINYGTGYSTQWVWNWGLKGATNENTWTIEESSTECQYLLNAGTVGVWDSQCYLCGDNTDYPNGACREKSETDGCRWIIAEVTSLPISLAEGKKYSTFYAPVAVTLPTDETLKAYTAAVDEGEATVTYTTVGTVIPAETGVLVKRAADDTTEKTYYLTVGGNPTVTEKGDLVGKEYTQSFTYDSQIIGSTTLSGKYVYTLQSGTFKGFNGTQLTGFKSHLELTTNPASEARAYTFFFNDETTGINAVSNNAANIQNGKYIQNGRMFIIKNGVKYNVNGQAIK